MKLNTVLDVHGDNWRGMSEERREVIRDWLREHGADPARVFTVRLVSEGCIEVEQYIRSSAGAIMMHPVAPDTPWTERITVPVGSVPEEWPL